MIVQQLDCQEFLDFCKADEKRANAILSRICEAHYAGGESVNEVSFDCRHKHDACNYTLNGCVKDGEEEFRFTIDDGNWNGTVVREWGTEENVGLYEPPPPPMYDMVPIDDSLEQTRPQMWKVYLMWKKEEWFKEILSSYAYDAHFAPGLKTEQYWRGKAKAKGLKIVMKERGE
jgi:hypothetical protein